MKRKLWLILIPVLVTGLCTAISFVAGHYVPWTPLGTPPEPAVEILRSDSSSVDVRAADSRVYRCSHWPRGAHPLSRACGWEEIDPADSGPGVPEIDETCSYFLPPGRVIDRFYFCSSPHWRYVVLADGSVWAFYSRGDETVDELTAGFVSLAFWPFLGPLASLLVGIIVFHFLRRRQVS